MRDFTKHVVPCLLTAALLGCGGVERKTKGTPIDSAPAAIAQTVCPKAYTCCTAAQLMGNSQAGTTEAECESKTADSWTQQINGVKASEMAGRSVYDGEKMDACLATIRESTCEQLNTANHLAGVPGCDSFVMPLVPVGGACFQTYECMQGWCKPSANMSGGDSTCQIPQDGEACGTNDPKCAPGFNCDDTTQKCIKPQPAGSPCTSGLQCDSGVCSSSGPGGSCTTRPASCFYSSGCAVGGAGRPTLLSLIGVAGVLGLAFSRRRRPSCRA